MGAVGAAIVVLLVVVVYGFERPDPSARPGPVATLPAAGGIRAVDFSPDGRLLAVGGDDGPAPDRKVALPGGPPATFGGGELGVVCIWDIAAGRWTATVTGFDSIDDLKALALGALRRLQKSPYIIRGSFRDPSLAYIQQAA